MPGSDIRAGRITGVVRRDDTTVPLGGVGDSWPLTWAPDDRLYASMNDGYGWGPADPRGMHNNRLVEIDGDPEAAVARFVPGYPELIGDRPEHYYGFGVLSVGDSLYVALAACDRPFVSVDGAPPAALWNGAKLIRSTDGGRTWSNQDGSTPVRWETHAEQSRETLLFHDEPDGAFSIVTYVTMGRGYADNRDGYVYGYSPNGNIDGTMNQLVLFRVAVDGMLDRSAYEFCAGTDAGGEVRWSASVAERAVVHEFPLGWVNRHTFPWSWVPSVAHHPGLDRYLMVCWGTSPTPDGGWFQEASCFGVWIADDPWGPWEQIHEEPAWLPGGDPASRAYAPQIVPKRMGADGSFWMAWSDFRGMEDVGRELAAREHELAAMDPASRAQAWMDATRSRAPGYSLQWQRVDLLISP